MSMNKLIMQIIEPAVDLDASVGDAFIWTVPHGIRVQDVRVVYMEATDAAIVTPGVVSVDYLATTAGASRTEMGTYTAEINKAIGSGGQLLDASSKAVNFLAEQGSTIYFEHKTQQSATETGQVKFILYGYLWPDAEVS